MATTTKARATAEPAGDVLTLAEAAAYLRVSEEDILGAVNQQRLPGRKIRNEWRFLKAALQDWLRIVPDTKEGLLQFVGSWRNDPFLEQLIHDVFEGRERPLTDKRSS